MRAIAGLVLLSAAVLGMAALFTTSAAAGAVAAGAPLPGERADVLVQVRPGASSASLAAAGGELEALLPGQGWYRLRQDGIDTAAQIARLKSDRRVLAVEPNYPIQADLWPNDPGLSQQWGINAINAAGAWDLTTGSASVIIAVIDTGVDLAHPDLVGKLVPGASFVAGVSSPQDDHGHGTHVAGIAAAATNNGEGIAGVSWGARLMPIKVLDSRGAGTYAELISGIRFAADNGAQIINMSLSGSDYSQALQDAIDDAYQRNVLLVAAAGNCAVGGGSCPAGNPPMYPGANAHVVSVAATDSASQRAYFSTHNSMVDVAAPGVSIYSTARQGSGLSYAYMTGTSQATPHVAGLAALVWSVRPELTNAEVEAALEQTAWDSNASFKPGRDDELGWGLVDARQAVDSTPPQSQVHILPALQHRESFVVSWSGSDENSGLRSYDIQFRDGAGGLWQNWRLGVSDTQALFFGSFGHTYYFRARARDRAANVEPYPPGDGDTHTTLSLCRISGQVRDNRAVAVAGASVRLEPGGLSAETDDSGGYVLAPPDCAGSALVAGRFGFGALAPMANVDLAAAGVISNADLYLPPAQNLLPAPDWDFEGGSFGATWADAGNTAPQVLVGQGHSGQYTAFVGTAPGGSAPGGESVISATVLLPAGLYRPTVSFVYRILTSDNTSHDYLQARLNGQAFWQDGYAGSDVGTQRDLGWRHAWLDLSAHAGQTVTVELALVQAGAYAGYPTGAYLDEVSIGPAAGGPHEVHLPLIVAVR